MVIIYLLKISGDVEEDTGPDHYSAQYLTICLWTLNSIAAHNFIKVAILKAYLRVHEMYIVYFTKLTSILLFELMMIICKFLGTAPLGLIMLQT